MYVSQRRDLLLELAHTVMKAEKSQILPGELTSWRLRRANNVVSI